MEPLNGEIAKLDALARFLGMDVDVAAEVESGRALYSGPMDVSPIIEQT